jgi:hypothetical protein
VAGRQAGPCKRGTEPSATKNIFGFFDWIINCLLACGNSHIDLLLHKLGTACYGVRKLSHVLGRNANKSVQFACFHLLIRYSVIFWGNSTNANKVFLLQKRVI